MAFVVMCLAAVGRHLVLSGRVFGLVLGLYRCSFYQCNETQALRFLKKKIYTRSSLDFRFYYDSQAVLNHSLP